MCTVECIKQKDGDTWPAVTFGLHRVVLEVDEDNEEVTSLVARHISGAQEIIAAANKGGHRRTRAPAPAIGTGAPEKKSANGFTNHGRLGQRSQEKYMATSRRRGPNRRA